MSFLFWHYTFKCHQDLLNSNYLQPFFRYVSGVEWIYVHSKNLFHEIICINHEFEGSKKWEKVQPFMKKNLRCWQICWRWIIYKISIPWKKIKNIYKYKFIHLKYVKYFTQHFIFNKWTTKKKWQVSDQPVCKRWCFDERMKRCG